MASLPRDKPKTNPPQLKSHARREERSGRLARAIELLEEVLRQTPDDWSSLQRLADLRARNGDRRAAVDLYRRLAEHYDQDDHVSRAIAAWRLVLRHDPAFLGTHLKLGELYARQGFRVESRIHYETAIAGFERAGRAREAAQARRSLDAVEGRAAGEAATTPPAAQANRSEAPAATGSAPAVSSTSPDQRPDDVVDPSSLDLDEFVAERLVEARMFRRYNLPGQARDTLEALLQRAPDHLAAREELIEILRDQGEIQRAAEEQRRLRPAATATTAPAAPDTAGDTAQRNLVGDDDLGSLEFTFLEEEPIPAEPGAEHVEPSPPADTARVEEQEAEVGAATPSNIFDDVLAAVEQSRPSDPPNPNTAPTGAEADPLPVFRQHVDSQISPEDYAARYDLGIAYREMGLVDEAISEFQLAARDPDRLVDCASLMAGCFVAKGLPGLAVKWLERGLAVPGIGDDERHALRYELGDALELASETRRALEVFTELYGEAAGHRDVAERVKRLHAVAPTREGT